MTARIVLRSVEETEPMKRLIGFILIACGLSFYVWHFLSLGLAPHFLQAIAGAVVLIVGLWFAMSPSPPKKF